MNREQETLGKVTPGRGRGIKGSTTKTPKSKGVKSSQTRKVTDIRKFFEAKVGSSSSNQEIGSNEERRTDSKEPDLELETGNGEISREETTSK